MTFHISKQKREVVRQKYNGKCAYCGHPLPKKWHVDHLEPLLRGVGSAHTGLAAANMHNHNDNNLMPSCPPCNISKGSMSIENWRNWLEQHLKSLNAYNSNYRIVKAFGLVVETGISIKFYFEVPAQKESL